QVETRHMSGDDKPRRLSDEDQALWQIVTRSIVPLKRRRMRRELPEGVRSPAKSHSKSHSKSQGKPPSLRPHAVPARPATRPPPLRRCGGRLRPRWARGRGETGPRLDLHGRTLSEAHAALLRFLHRAQGEGAKIVLVITGKGGAEADRGRGVL